MEKRKRDRVEDEAKFIKKKSKAQLVGFAAAKRLGPKGKQALQETKESFSGKPAQRKSASCGKKQKENLERSGSSFGLHHKPYNLNSRYLTEALPTKMHKEPHKKLVKSSLISPERTTFHDVFSRSSKDRLSLNDARKPGNPESAKAKSTLCEQFSIQELAETRKDIQKVVKRTCLKESISRKDLLNITNQYEKLLTRIVFSEVVDSANNAECFPEENEESLTFRVQEGKKGKPVCPGLHLQKVKALKIDDYHDEFMAHYDQLSESWKRDIEVQRRY